MPKRPENTKPIYILPPDAAAPEGGPVVTAADRNAALQAVAGALSRGAEARAARAFFPDLATLIPAAAPYIRFPARKSGPGQAAWKWLFDKTLAAAMVFLLTPVWLPMFAAIKVDSRGPIIFRQKRLTVGRREFNIYKFRTMFATVPQYQLSPPGDDIRVTRVGLLLRRLGLDETAQLINVLKGQMSTVGPRPEMAVVAAAYEPWQNFRFTVKPGITGLWQIAGRAGRPIHENLEFDFYYITNRSFALDVKIFLNTIPILIGKGKRH